MTIAERIEQLYDCTPPTKTDVDLICLLGTSLINGFACVRATMDASVANYYVPTGDQIWFKRYYGKGLTYTDAEIGYFLPYNSTRNFTTTSFAPDAPFGKITSVGYTWPRPIYIYCYSVAGVSIIANEQATTWNPSDDSTYWTDMISRLHEAVNYLKAIGLVPRLSVLWGSAAVTSTTATDYSTAINAMIASIRSEFDASDIYFKWSKPPLSAGAADQAYRDGVDIVTGADSYVSSYDCLDFQLTGGHFTNYSEIIRGVTYAAFLYEKLYGGTRPTCTSPSIIGTLQSAQPIGFTYTYSGIVSENKTVVADTRRLDAGFGTRCEIWIADDVLGTNSDFVGVVLNYGETWNISVGSIGKYLQSRVWVVAQSGALHGYCVKGAWQGPVIA